MNISFVLRIMHFIRSAGPLQSISQKPFETHIRLYQDYDNDRTLLNVTRFNGKNGNSTFSQYRQMNYCKTWNKWRTAVSMRVCVCVYDCLTYVHCQNSYSTQRKRLASHKTAWLPVTNYSNWSRLIALVCPATKLTCGRVRIGKMKYKTESVPCPFDDRRSTKTRLCIYNIAFDCWKGGLRIWTTDKDTKQIPCSSPVWMLGSLLIECPALWLYFSHITHNI